MRSGTIIIRLTPNTVQRPTTEQFAQKEKKYKAGMETTQSQNTNTSLRGSAKNNHRMQRKPAEGQSVAAQVNSYSKDYIADQAPYKTLITVLITRSAIWRVDKMFFTVYSDLMSAAASNALETLSSVLENWSDGVTVDIWPRDEAADGGRVTRRRLQRQRVTAFAAASPPSPLLIHSSRERTEWVGQRACTRAHACVSAG